MTTDQTDHRAEAERSHRNVLASFSESTSVESFDLHADTAAYHQCEASLDLLAAIHDEQRVQTGLLTDLRGAIDDLAETLRPAPKWADLFGIDPKFSPGGHVAGPTEVHEAGGCDECSSDWCTEPDPEPDAKSDPGPEPAPRALICTEAEAEAHREVRRLVITTYQIEDDPAVLRGADGADMTTAALVWLEGFVQAVDPDAHPAYTGKPEKPSEPDTETVTLPRGAVDVAWARLEVAASDPDANQEFATRHRVAADALLAALDAATNPYTRQGADDARD